MDLTPTIVCRYVVYRRPPSFCLLSTLPPPLQSAAGTARLNALGLQVLAMQAGSSRVLPERIVRERLGNNPDTSKALRRCVGDL